MGGTDGDGVVRSAYSAGLAVGGSGVSEACGAGVGDLAEWDGDVGAVMYCGDEGYSRAKERSMSWDWGSRITARGEVGTAVVDGVGGILLGSAVGGVDGGEAGVSMSMGCGMGSG